MDTFWVVLPYRNLHTFAVILGVVTAVLLGEPKLLFNYLLLLSYTELKAINEGYV